MTMAKLTIYASLDEHPYFSDDSAFGYIGYSILATDDLGRIWESYSAGNSLLDSQAYITSHPLDEPRQKRATKTQLKKWALVTLTETIETLNKQGHEVHNLTPKLKDIV